MCRSLLKVSTLVHLAYAYHFQVLVQLLLLKGCEVTGVTSTTEKAERLKDETGIHHISNVKMSGSGRVMLFLHDTEGLAWKVLRHRFREASAMPNPHDQPPILVTESEQLLLPMHQRFLCVLKCASQVASFQTQTLLHLISHDRVQGGETFRCRYHLEKRPHPSVFMLICMLKIFLMRSPMRGIL